MGLFFGSGNNEEEPEEEIREEEIAEEEPQLQVTTGEISPLFEIVKGIGKTELAEKERWEDILKMFGMEKIIPPQDIIFGNITMWEKWKYVKSYELVTTLFSHPQMRRYYSALRVGMYIFLNNLFELNLNRSLKALNIRIGASVVGANRIVPLEEGEK